MQAETEASSLVRPEISDAKLGLPGKDITWQTRRTNMVDVCLSCHNQHFVDSFYKQYDSLIDLYHEKFAKPGLALYAAAKPLLNPAQFSNPIDFTWYEIWHHEGRRARHGASMMGPDYTHWHGTYEVAKHFYSHYVPELRELIEHHKDSADPAKKEAAAKLAKLLDETLNSPNHQWYLNKMSPEEKASARGRGGSIPPAPTATACCPRRRRRRRSSGARARPSGARPCARAAAT